MRIPYRRTDWHRWFAWHPVETSSGTVWLEYVERMFVDNASSAGDFSGYSFDVPGWIYRDLQQ